MDSMDFSNGKNRHVNIEYNSSIFEIKSFMQNVSSGNNKINNKWSVANEHRNKFRKKKQKILNFRYRVLITIIINPFLIPIPL